MQRISFSLLTSITALSLGVSLKASDPVGIYTIIDRVVFEPSIDNPDKVRLWGAFSLSTGPGMGDTYHAPQRGYMYFAINPDNPKASIIEWNDLNNLAGSDQCIGFASRYQPMGTVRPGCEPPANPDIYPVAMGLIKSRSDTEYQPIADLSSLPAPRQPEDGSPIAAGQVELTVRNVLASEHEGATYHFELLSRYGELLESGKVVAGSKFTTWAPDTAVEAGYEYRWTCQASQGDWKGQVARACFTTPFLRADANGDKEVDISDAVNDLVYLFSGGRAPRPLAAGDVDGNGTVELTDAIYLLVHLFQGGPAPPPPFPEPGLIPPSSP